MVQEELQLPPGFLRNPFLWAQSGAWDPTKFKDPSSQFCLSDSVSLFLSRKEERLSLLNVHGESVCELGAFVRVSDRAGAGATAGGEAQ
jgi:hypothetical protein